MKFLTKTRRLDPSLLIDDLLSSAEESNPNPNPNSLPSPSPPSGSAVCITLAKPNPNTSPSQLLDAVADATRSGAEGVLQISYGENFSPAWAKGYEVGVIAVFPGVEEMEKAMEGAETAKEKVRPLFDSVG